MQFEIWDTAGQERFKALGSLYYKGAKGAIVVFDITNKNSFKRAIDWIKELENNADAGIIITLVGNKCDLNSSRAISKKEAEELATVKNLLYFECSAKTGDNVNRMFIETSMITSEKDPNYN